MTDPPREPAAAIDPAHTAETLGLVRWLLDVASTDGLALTQTGALARAIVREGVQRRPEWWNTELQGPPYQEAEIPPLEGLHLLLRRARLPRRRGCQLLATPRGRDLRTQPAALLHAVAHGLLAADRSDAMIQTHAMQVLASDGSSTTDELARCAATLGISHGWRVDGQPPRADDVRPIIDELVWTADATGLVTTRYENGWRVATTDVGRVAFQIATTTTTLNTDRSSLAPPARMDQPPTALTASGGRFGDARGPTERVVTGRHVGTTRC